MLKSNDWLLNPRECPGFEKAELIDHLERPPLIHHTEHLHLHLPKRYALVNLNEEIEAVLKRSKVRDGLCFVSAMHITAGVYVNDAESGLLKDNSEWIENLAPFGKNYLHHQTDKDLNVFS